MSFYGVVNKFKSRKNRDTYYEEKTGYGDLVVKGSKSDMRKLCLGCSIREFNADIDFSDFSD